MHTAYINSKFNDHSIYLMPLCVCDNQMANGAKELIMFLRLSQHYTDLIR